MLHRSAAWSSLGLFWVCLVIPVPQGHSTRWFCSQDNVTCLVPCTHGRCVCPGDNGDGALMCENGGGYSLSAGTHEGHGVLCHYKHICDPKFKPFSGGPTIELNLPCRHLVTDIVYRKYHPHSGHQIYRCRAVVHAFQKRSKGKFFISGADVRVSYRVGFGPVCHFGMKVYGVGMNGTYTYTMKTCKNGGPFMMSTSVATLDSDIGGHNLFEHQPHNNRVVIVVERCGIYVAFRAADCSLGRYQVDSPGLAIAAACYTNKYDVSYRNTHAVLALTPILKSMHVTATMGLPEEKRDLAFLFRAIVASKANAFSGGAIESCTNLEEMANNCTNVAARNQGLMACQFIFYKPLFTHCYSNNTDSRDLIDLFSDCMKSFCCQDYNMCTMVADAIEDRNCHHKPGGDDFYMNGCDPLMPP